METLNEAAYALETRIILIESKLASSNPAFKPSYSITQLLDGLKQIIAKFPVIEPFLSTTERMNMIHELPISIDSTEKQTDDDLIINEKKLVITSSLSNLNSFVLQFDELISQLDIFEKLYNTTEKFYANYDSKIFDKFESISSKFNLQLVRTIKLLEKQLLLNYEKYHYYNETFEKLRNLQEQKIFSG